MKGIADSKSPIAKGGRFRRLNCRAAGAVHPDVARLLRPRPVWPLVKWSAEFAAFQERFRERPAAWYFQRIKESL